MIKKFLLGLQKKISNGNEYTAIHSKKHTMIVISVIIGLLITVFAGNYSNAVQKDISVNLLRLHILANSDSNEDQELKLKVRDAVLAEMTKKFQSSKSIDETKKIAKENLSNIVEIASKVIESNGKKYSVKAKIENIYFPTKYYGDIALPAGYYDALRVEIGKAEGHNWWCVLFPPLCFANSAKGSLPDSSKSQLKNVLSKEEYDLITSANSNDNIPVKIKFKTVELWQESQHKVRLAISSIF